MADAPATPAAKASTQEAWEPRGDWLERPLISTGASVSSLLSRPVKLPFLASSAYLGSDYDCNCNYTEDAWCRVSLGPRTVHTHAVSPVYFIIQFYYRMPRDATGRRGPYCVSLFRSTEVLGSASLFTLTFHSFFVPYLSLFLSFSVQLSLSFHISSPSLPSVFPCSPGAHHLPPPSTSESRATQT